MRKHREKMCSRLVTASLLLATVAIAGGLPAAAQGAQDTLAVEYVHPYVFLRISHTTDLQAVLERLCRRTECRCEIAPAAAEEVVAPLTTVGTWLEVLSVLMEGSKLNYAAMPPGPGRLGTLVVEPPSATVLPPPARRPGELEVRTETEAVTTRKPPPRSPSLTDEEIRQLREREEAPREESPPASPVTVDTIWVQRNPPSPEMAGPSAQERQKAEKATWDLLLGLTPTRPASPPGTRMLPFPDANGNPIIVPAGQQGPTALPFPDVFGRPIPIPPKPPGQPVSSPFPPKR